MNRRLAAVLVLSISLGVLARELDAQQATAAQPPVAPVRPVTDDYFGTKVVDNYRYFENLKDPEVQQWMKAQADYARATLDALPGYGALFKRIDALFTSQPAWVDGVQIVGGHYYSLRTPANAQSPKLYVRDGVKGQDKLLIDPEKIPGNDTSHYSIVDYRPSPDGRYIAYLVAAGGSEEGVLHIRDVKTSQDLPETADRMDITAPYWRPDGRAFFYARGQKLEPGVPPAAKDEGGRVYLHMLGRSFEQDPSILGHGVPGATIEVVTDEYPAVVTAADSRYAIAFVSPGTDPRMRVYAAPIDSIRDGKTPWRAIAASYDDQFIGRDMDNPAIPVIALTGDTLYWLSRKNAPRGEILKLDLSRADSKPVVSVAQGDLPISAVYASRGAIYWRVNDASAHSIYRLLLKSGARREELKLPYAGDVADVSTDAAGDGVALLVYSWLRSSAYLGIDPATGALGDNGLKPSGPYDHADDLAVDEVKVRSWDGTLVPMSIIHKKGITLDGNNLTMITGYGAYGISMSPFYGLADRSWYERGGVNVFAHVRGGGELGEAWHKAGFQQTKPNTWKDFIACAQYLVDHHYTNPHKLVGHGGSAGGILIGRAIEERPDLFAAAVADVPAADMLRFGTTASGIYNTPEFGSTKSQAGFRALYAMSAYANIKDGVKYPAVLVTTGINDPRVAPWEPAKFAARLQAATASGKPVLLRVDYDAGHGLDATRRQWDLAITDMLAFALWQTGDPDFQPVQR